MLQANYGPWPYWTVADLKSTIAATCRTLYAVNIEGGIQYLLAVLRTPQADCPLAICKRACLYALRFILMIRSVNPQRDVISQAIRAADPKLSGKLRIIEHPNGRKGIGAIGTPPPDITPTEFFVIADEDKGTYRTQQRPVMSIHFLHLVAQPMLQVSLPGTRLSTSFMTINLSSLTRPQRPSRHFSKRRS
jgi:hypothetical protein